MSSTRSRRTTSTIWARSVSPSDRPSEACPATPDNRYDENMPDILQDFPIKADAGPVFEAVSSAEGLDHWWTETCSGQARLGASFDLGFGPDYQWRAKVT